MSVGTVEALSFSMRGIAVLVCALRVLRALRVEGL